MDLYQKIIEIAHCNYSYLTQETTIIIQEKIMKIEKRVGLI